MLFYVLCAVLALPVLALAFLYSRHLRFTSDSIPYPEEYSFIYGSLAHEASVAKTFDEPPRLNRRLGSVYQFPFPLALGRMVVVSDPHWIDHLTLKTNSSKVWEIYSALGEFIGKTSILLRRDHAEWQGLRRQMGHAFTPQSLKDQMPLLERRISSLMETLNNNIGKEVLMDQLLVNMTFDFIQESAFGALFSERDSLEFKKALKQAAKEIIKVQAEPIRILRIYEETRLMDRNIATMRRLCKSLIDEIRNRNKDVSDLSPNSIWASIESLKMSDDVAIDQIITFLFAGHDTTAHSMSYFIAEMNKHPEVVAKIREEVDAVLGDSLMPTHSQLSSLNYLNLCIKESMRMHPPTRATIRVVDETATINGITLQKGEWVMLSQYGAHYDPSVWPDPYEFKPERFLKEVEATRSRGSYLPFSLGPRDCMGKGMALQEMALTLAALYKRFDFVFPEGYKIKKEADFTVRPADSLPVTVQLRK